MPEIQSLELVSLREARPNEAQDSTPHLDQLMRAEEADPDDAEGAD